MDAAGAGALVSDDDLRRLFSAVRPSPKPLAAESMPSLSASRPLKALATVAFVAIAGLVSAQPVTLKVSAIPDGSTTELTRKAVSSSKCNVE